MIENLLPLIEQHGIIISFLIGFITGESFIIPLAFLSAQGYIALWKVVIFCTLGMYLSEFIPFTIGRTPFLRKFIEKRLVSPRMKKIEEKLHKHSMSKPFLTLIISKFTYGLSIPTIIYFSYKKMPYSKFAIYTALVNLIFVPIVIAIGWFGGRGFKFIISDFESIRIAIFLLIVLIIIFFYIRKWIDRRLIKMQER